MSDPPPRSRSGWLTAFMMLAGLILLLPGLCALATIVITVPGTLTGLFSGRPRLDSQFLIVAGPWVGLWAICLLLSWWGIRLIRRSGK